MADRRRRNDRREVGVDGNRQHRSLVFSIEKSLPFNEGRDRLIVDRGCKGKNVFWIVRRYYEVEIAIREIGHRKSDLRRNILAGMVEEAIFYSNLFHRNKEIF